MAVIWTERTAAALGVDALLPAEHDSAAGGRDRGYLFVLELSTDRLQFVVTADPAAPRRQWRSAYIG